MTKIVFTSNENGAGSIDFLAPNTNTNFGVTLPAAGGQMHTSESANDHASMPTVAGDPIVESGSNTDGEWVRYSDGTMFVYGTRGEGGDNNLTNITLPQVFIVPSGYDNFVTATSLPSGTLTYPATIISAYMSQGGGNIVSNAGVTSSTDGTTGDRVSINFTGASTDFRRFSCGAVGRWK